MKKRKNHSDFILGVIGIYLFIPLFFTLVYSLFSEWMDVLPSGFTLKAYHEIFSDSTFWMSVGRTVLISVLPIIICTLVVLLAMYVVVVHCPKLDKYMKILCTMPYAIQGVILPISVLTLYANAPEPFSNRVFMLTSTYCIVVLPYIYQGIRNNLNGMNVKGLIEAAQMLGAGRFFAFFGIVVPNIMNGIVVSAMLAMGIVFGDFVVINTIAGSYFPTAQIYLYGVMKQSGQRTCAVIVVLFCVTLLISASVFMRKRGKNSGVY
ncbi:MAG: ABC transporter permease subunit [Clostridium sp.]